MSKRPPLTTEVGACVLDNQRSETAGSALLLQDHHLIAKLARFNRERIPERVVHAVGTGAYGYFETTNPDLSQWTRMRPFASVGKRTEVFARFSTVVGARGAPDLTRDPRGFALKFQTEDGVWDLVANNTPVFFIRDGMKFPDLIHAFKYDPYTNRQEPENIWDFFSHTPEATHQYTWLFGDRGIPASWRQMNGYSGHAYAWVNNRGERCWVKFHFISEQGVAYYTQQEAERLAGQDAQYLHHEFYQAIEQGNHPAWTCKVQIMPDEAANSYRFNPFDVTKVWPHGDYPLVTVGRLVLNRLPENYYAHTEQVAFDPAHMIPGIAPSPDRMLQARLFAYGDAHRYRLGVNHTHLPVNRPTHAEAGVNTYARDGAMCIDDNGAAGKNYEPNSFNGPVAVEHGVASHLALNGHTGHYPHPQHREDNDFVQAGNLYRIMQEDARARLVENISRHLAQIQRGEIVERAIDHFTSADAEYGRRVAAGVAGLRG